MTKMNNTRDPQQDRSRDTKNRIVEAGLKLFSKKGFYNTNSKEIAKVAGVAIGSFYAYFKDKKELFLAILFHYHEEIRSVIHSIDAKEYIDSGKSKEFIEYLINKLIEMHDINPEFHQDVAVLSQTDADVRTFLKKSDDESIEATILVLNLWKKHLRIQDIETAAVIINKSIEEIVHTIVLEDTNIDRDKLINETTDMIYRYLFKK